MNQVLLLNIGDFLADLSIWFRTDEDHPALTSLQRCAMQALCIQTAEGTVLVDAPAYTEESDELIPIPDYTPPPPLVAQLAQADIQPEDVAHVVITHAHFDHFNGLGVEVDEGDWQPAFPNAVHHLGQGDWNVIQHKLFRNDSLESRTLGQLHGSGRLALIQTEQTILPGVTVIPAPGESPGHQIVQVELERGLLYHVGDLIHHPVEVERPEWACWWAERPQHDKNRKRLLQRALGENALLLASHVHGFGRVIATQAGLRWVEADTD